MKLFSYQKREEIQPTNSKLSQKAQLHLEGSIKLFSRGPQVDEKMHMRTAFLLELSTRLGR